MKQTNKQLINSYKGNKMPYNRNEKCFLLSAMIVITMCFITIGCNTDASGVATGNGSGEAGTKKVPSFTFHKPKELSTAISRVRELHDAITGNDPLPSPIEYQVKEIVHGEGESGHSHYFLHDEDTDESAADDGDVTTGENIHSVSIEPIEEQKDLIRWLPKIASAGDMAEAQWTQVNDISKQMTPQLYAIIEASTDQDKQRDSYREHADSFSKQISALEELLAK